MKHEPGADLLNLRVVDMDELAASTKGRTPTGPMRLRAVPTGAGVGVPAADAQLPEAQGSNGGSSGQAGGMVGHDGPGGPVTRPARSISVVVPIRTGRGQNDRLHWRAKAKQVKAEKEAVAWSLGGKTRPALPCVVTLTRVAPSVGLDDDNNSGSLKGCRDSVAQWLGVDDRDARVRWAYGQARGPWAVKVEIQEVSHG